jgi:hypothetical protein
LNRKGPGSSTQSTIIDHLSATESNTPGWAGSIELTQITGIIHGKGLS